MPKPRNVRLIVAALVWLICGLGSEEPARAQDIRPLAPVLEPAEPGNRPEVPGPAGEDPELIPLPQAPSRTAAASRDRVRVAAVLPASWSGVTAQYQPYWTGITSVNGFGLHGLTPYFAAAGLVPILTPHPFLGPWGMLGYEGWLFDRYRSVWGSPRSAGPLGDAAEWLQRGDHAMANSRAADAAHAYRRVTLAAPDFPLGYLGLGAALAELGDDEAAARAFRQSLDRYPAWLALSVDWALFYGNPGRLASVQAAAAERAEAGGAASRFVAGVLYLFGDRADLGRGLLAGLEGDRHAELLVTRGPR